MLMLNQHTIDNFQIGGADLERIQAALAQQDGTHFDRLIRDPLYPELTDWIRREFPQLRADAEDMVGDSFAKLRKVLLRQHKAGQSGRRDVGAQILELARLECQWTLPTPENLRKNLGLRRGEFKNLLRRLQTGDEELIERVYLGQFKRCVQFLIHRCGGQYEEAYQCTMDALLEIRRDLLEERIYYGNLDFYFTKRAVGKLNKLRSRRRQQIVEVTLDGLDFAAEERIESEIAAEELRATIAEAFQKLCDDCRTILRQYYYEEQSFKAIAVQLQKSHAAIRKRATRCREQLRKYLGSALADRFSQHR
ncbi:MAG: sigma-70 family RNA polymerase sigma factor [Bacteroidota bacterium]